MAHHYNEDDKRSLEREEREQAAKQNRIEQHNVIIQSLSPEEKDRYDLAVKLFHEFSESAQGKKVIEALKGNIFSGGVTTNDFKMLLSLSGALPALLGKEPS